MEMTSHKGILYFILIYYTILSGHWLSFQVHLALEGDGANHMLRPYSPSSFSELRNRGLPRLPCIALYCLVLIREGSPTPLLPQSGL